MFWIFRKKRSAVQTILEGSRNLDALEQDIERFCRLTLWLLYGHLEATPQHVPVGFRHADWFDLMYRHNEDYYWQLALSNNRPCGIRLWLPRLSNDPVFEYRKGQQMQIHPAMVRDIHDKLDALYTGVVAKFPSMETQYRPYRRATEV